MSSTVETTTEIRPFTSTFRRSSSTTCAGASPRRAGPARSSSKTDRRACSWRRCRSSPATGRPTTTGARPRRSSTPCRSSRPRSTGSTSTSSTCARSTRRVAADHDARLARLGHRAARDRRPADRPDRARRTRRGRVPPGAAVPARLRLLRRADRARLGRRPRRAGLGGADEPPRLHPLRRPGRRRGRPRHRR